MPQQPANPINLDLQAHLDAGNIRGVGQGGAVNVWPDDSQRGNHFNLTGGAPAPTLDTTAANGQPAVLFTQAGTSSRLDKGGFPASNEWSYVLVWKATTTQGTNVPRVMTISGADTLSTCQDLSGTGSSIFVYANPVVTGINATDWHITTVIGTGGNSQTIFVDGEDFPSASAGAFGGASTWAIGRSAVGTEGLTGYVAEVWLFNKALPAAQRQAIERLMSTKYRIPLTTAFDPSTLSGLAVWYDFSDGSSLWQDTARTSPVTLYDQIIKGVTDKSGNGRHLSEATNGPTWKVNVQNGRGVARFDGVNDTIASGSFGPLAVPNTVMIVWKNIGGGWLVYDLGGNMSLKAADPVQFYNGATFSPWALPTGHRIHTMIWNGANSRAFLDGGKTFAGDVGTGNPGASLITLDPFGESGEYAEFLLWNRQLGQGEINKVGEYLAAKWGVPWTPTIGVG